MLSSLTGIRGYAVLLVLFSHASNVGFNLHSTVAFNGAGRYGVFLFFVLSSFLLTRQFLIRDQNSLPLPEFLSHYFLRRCLRIFPLYVTCLTVYYLLGIVMQPLYVDSFSVYVNSLLLLDGPGIFWTIPVEFQYYFVLPFVALGLLALKNSPLVCLVITALLVASWQFLFEPDYKPHLLPFLSIFIVGSFTAYIYEWANTQCAGLVQSGWFRTSCGLVSLGSFLSFIVLIPHFYNMLFGTDVPQGHFHYDFVLLSILSSILVLSTLWSEGYLRTILDSKLMVFWGEVSFSAYLGHMLILKAMTYLDIYIGNATVVLFIALVALFSYLSYRFFEYPMSKVHNLKRLGIHLSSGAR